LVGEERGDGRFLSFVGSEIKITENRLQRTENAFSVLCSLSYKLDFSS